MKRASTPEDAPNSCEGSVNGTDITFMIDTGASISVVPREYVSSVSGCGTVFVMDANGGTRRRQKAKVTIEIEGKTFEREVALAPRGEIGDKALFPVNLSSSDDFGVIRYFREKNGLEKANKVSMRSECNDNNKNWKLKLDEEAEKIMFDGDDDEGFMSNIMLDVPPERDDFAGLDPGQLQPKQIPTNVRVVECDG